MRQILAEGEATLSQKAYYHRLIDELLKLDGDTNTHFVGSDRAVEINGRMVNILIARDVCLAAGYVGNAYILYPFNPTERQETLDKPQHWHIQLAAPKVRKAIDELTRAKSQSK